MWVKRNKKHKSIHTLIVTVFDEQTNGLLELSFSSDESNKVNSNMLKMSPAAPQIISSLYVNRKAGFVSLCVHVHACRPLTSVFGWQATHPSAHGSESPQILLQALVGLFVQPSHSPELGPVETAKGWVKNHTKRRDHPVKVSLLSSGPSEESGTGKHVIYVCDEQLLCSAHFWHRKQQVISTTFWYAMIWFEGSLVRGAP